MKSGGGKEKGNRYEWEVSRRLSAWLTNGEDRDQLVPSRSSGGWMGADGIQRWRNVGDIAPNGPAGGEFRRRFAVECKHRRQILWWWLWTRQPSEENLHGWWTKLVAEIDELDGDHAPPVPLVVFKANHRPQMVATLPEVFPDRAPLTVQVAGGVVAPAMVVGTLDDFLNTSPSDRLGRVDRLWEKTTNASTR